MFTLPPPEGECPEGSTTENPIVLAGVSTTDFDRFLSILYPLNFNANEINTIEEWSSVLHLASQWDFSSLRQLAIDNLAILIMSPIDRIVIGQAYHIPEWLVPAYTELCMRDDPLTLDEGKKLGMEDVITIGQLRQEVRYRSNLNRYHETIKELVRDTFVVRM